jgi:phosphoribosylformylglycinamidine cyclo-ligase
MAKSYKDSGVDILAGEQMVNNIKNVVKQTFNKNVLTGLGSFGAFYSLDLSDYREPVLVSSVDGVGTKLKIAIEMDIHNTVGQDLVNHCVNDIAVGGAKPLYFLDYLAFGKLNLKISQEIIGGFAKACKENEVSLIGGETAEMPGIYAEKDYDMSGTIVGIVEKSKIINGNSVSKGDVLIGFASNGLHTNGYSLARNVLFERLSVEYKSPDLQLSLGEELLRVHKSYLSLINILKDSLEIKAFSHITGGGIIGNTKRVVPVEHKIAIDWSSWEIPALFQLIQKEGEISDEEMRNVFNLGIGLIAIVTKDDVNHIFNLSKTLNFECKIIGEIQ